MGPPPHCQALAPSPQLGTSPHLPNSRGFQPELPRCVREEEGRACACTHKVAYRTRPERVKAGREPSAPGPAPGGGTRPGVWAAARCRRRAVKGALGGGAQVGSRRLKPGLRSRLAVRRQHVEGETSRWRRMLTHSPGKGDPFITARLWQGQGELDVLRGQQLTLCILKAGHALLSLQDQLRQLLSQPAVQEAAAAHTAALIRGNRKNCAQFSGSLDWLISQLERLEASSGILEFVHCVLVESPEALNIIKEGHIKSIISLLDKHGRNHKVLDVLRSLCVCHG
ncbi:uncharacterized protein LOC141573277 isoform X2 [Camelus bactrianus]|uniref:Uncharacterized protein LOC141573277 isoform X2 n=1 Tax=Camelus bactrianus TaxID=9837 RepID=A0AC58NYS7_CAMBA